MGSAATYVLRGWLIVAAGAGAFPRLRAPAFSVDKIRVICYIPYRPRTEDFMADGIDWGRLRARLLETPYVVKPKHIKHPNRSPESLERRRVSARARSKKHYWENREECLAAQRAWEIANPDKVKAKKKRFYDAHKDDPVWMENHRRMNRETKQRARFKKYVLTMSILCMFKFSSDLGNLRIAA